MKKQWVTPEGEYYEHIKHMTQQHHLLIAGCSGSGKSVLINTLIYQLLYESPATLEILLIDPKRVELSPYKKLPHCVGYASEHNAIIKLLQSAVDTMESRYKQMERQGLRTYNGKALYIIFDEFGDLMTTSKKEVEPLIIRLAQLGRAAKIHLILATQNPSRQTITAGIKVNITASVALRCREPIESRMILGVKGAELLPRYGHGYYFTPEHTTPQLVPIPLTSDEEINQRIAHWVSQDKKLKNIFSLFTRH
jgi:S-DNA-T family DNA segregation ATPase FtsK/SpoIIIE